MGQVCVCASLVQKTQQRLGLLTGLGPIQIPGVPPPATHEGAHSRDETLWTGGILQSELGNQGHSPSQAASPDASGYVTALTGSTHPALAGCC